MDTVLSWMTVERVSLIAAVLALVIALWSAVISRSNMKAAMRSAEAAEAQANAALDQAREASRQSGAARDFAEVDALHTEKARIDRAAPSVVITLSPLDDKPRVASDAFVEPIPQPAAGNAEPRPLDCWGHGHDDVYFVLKGTLYNDGDRAVRVHPDVVTFYAGAHPVTGTDVPVPCRSAVEHVYLLYPGQCALFEMRPAHQIDLLLSPSDDTEDTARPFAQHRLVLQPGSVDDPSVFVTVTTRADPIRRWDGDSSSPIHVKDHCPLNVTIERAVRYPRSFEHARPTGGRHGEDAHSPAA